MRRRKLLYIILIFSLLIFSVACAKNTDKHPTLIVDDYNGVDLDKIDHYKIEVDFDPDNKSYLASQKVTYTNNSQDELNKVYFHIYPNAYKSIETAPILFDNTTAISKSDYDFGDMEIKKILLNKEEVDFQIGGISNSILKISLPQSLKPQERIDIQIEYIVKLPQNIDRFGYGEEIFNFGNWYPIACVYDESGWNLDPYYSIGDPFYSNISNYDIKITAPKNIVIASSGNLLSEKIKGDKKIHTIEGKLIRDFTWAASPNFKVKEVEVEGIKIKLYSLEENHTMEKFASNVGKDCIEIFNRIFGKYPYGQYSIVMTEFPTGMEYPGLVFIGKDFFNIYYKNALEMVIVHETAHQWWYGVVGNDQIDEAWLDESLATYSEVIYMYEKHGDEYEKDYYDYFIKESYEHGKNFISKDNRIVKPLNEFSGWDDYGLLVYTKGAMFLEEIKEDFGREILYDILNKYYNTYKFHNARTEDFIKICEEVTATSFNERVDRWLYGKDFTQ